MNAPASGLDIEVDDIFGIDVPGREIIGKDLACIAGRTAAGDHSFDGSLLIQGEHAPDVAGEGSDLRSEEHTSELQSLMRISYAVFCLTKKRTGDYETTSHSTKPQTATTV